MTRTHRFRPRYRGLAWGSIGMGGALAGLGAVISVGTLPIAGVIGMAFGLLYLGSPTWKLAVVTDDDGLAVTGPRGDKLRLAWREVVRVVASEATAFVDGGAPERSLLVPGDGAPAPYAIDDARGLVATIVSRVDADRVTRVESLDRAPKPDHPA